MTYASVSSGGDNFSRVAGQEHPAERVTIQEPQNPSINQFHVMQKCRSTDFFRYKVVKCLVGQEIRRRGRYSKPSSPTEHFTIQEPQTSIVVSELRLIVRL